MIEVVAIIEGIAILVLVCVLVACKNDYKSLSKSHESMRAKLNKRQPTPDEMMKSAKEVSAYAKDELEDIKDLIGSLGEYVDILKKKV